MSIGDSSNCNSSLSSKQSVSCDFTATVIIGCFVGIAWYNSIELVGLCFLTFKRYRGCYFLSLLIASISIIPFALGYIIILFVSFSNYFALVLLDVAWWGMVTGQSLVLWSRLHLIVSNRKVLRATLGMIIIDAILLHPTGPVLEIGSHATQSRRFTTAFSIFERIQLVVFSVQETILSTIYAWKAVQLLKLRPKGRNKSILIQLLITNLVMIIMDVAIISLQYTGLFTIHVTFKAMVYSVKLKLEYAILGQLVRISSTRSALTDDLDR